MEKLIELIAEVLETDKSKIGPDTTRDDIEEWDSFAHLSLIAEVEERFGVKIPFDGIVEIKKVGDFLKYIKG